VQRTGGIMLLLLAILLGLAVLAIHFARVTHVVLIMLFLGVIAGGTVFFAAGYITQFGGR
jgi:hypothetical protein